MSLIYSENNHKVINLFGIKLKFKSKIHGYFISGENNKILLVENGKTKELNKHDIITGLDVKIIGNNNIILIKSSYFVNCSIRINASNSNIEIGQNCKLNNFHISAICGNYQQLKIGDETTSYYTEVHLNEENACLEIGKDCMLSSNIVIWPTDGHAIVDKNTEKVINKPNKTIIGDHCWIGYGVHICKNTHLLSDVIIGARSVVTKGFKDSNIVIAGNPAKIIKNNVRWSRHTATNEANEMAKTHVAVERERERVILSNCIKFIKVVA